MSDEMCAEYDDPELMASNLRWFEEAKKAHIEAQDHLESYEAWRRVAEGMDVRSSREERIQAALAREQHAKATAAALDARLAEANTLLGKYKEKYGAIE